MQVSTASSVFVARISPLLPLHSRFLLPLFSFPVSFTSSQPMDTQAHLHVVPHRHAFRAHMVRNVPAVAGTRDGRRNARSQWVGVETRSPSPIAHLSVSLLPKTRFLADAEMITCHTSGFDLSNPSHESTSAFLSSGPLHLVFFCFSFPGWSRRDATFGTQAFERQRRSSR